MLIHAFGGSVEILRQLEQLGCYFSFGCALLDPKRKRPRAAVKAVRLDRLLLESDAPTLPPPKEFRPPWMQLDAHGEARNEPAIVPTVLETIAELRGISGEELASATDENGRRFCGDRLYAW
jgi:TatD DNase family protein